jgi:hypothetical protein
MWLNTNTCRASHSLSFRSDCVVPLHYCKADAFCMGSANIRLDDGAMSLFHFSVSANCDVTTDEQNIATIRGYPKLTGVCTRDGITRTPETYYKLAETDGADGLMYNGVLNCTSSDCDAASCAVVVKNWAAGSCNTVRGCRLRLWWL